MARSKEQLDEYLLAAYLSGDLPRNLRSEISAYLVDDERARDLLTMAGDALTVASEGDGAGYPHVQEPIRAPVMRSTELPYGTDQSLWKLIIVVSVTVLLLTVALAWHIVTDPPTGAVGPDDGWAPTVDASTLGLRWPEIQDAVAYRVVVQDPSSGVAFTAGTTTSPAFDADHSTVWQEADLSARTVAVWLEALDADGMVTHRSSSIQVVR